ncbi:MAG TPA: pyridoxamine 5'-phosphate oxidase family protein [Aeromonadales bacterium]|nr:pyridoxamine 5'-phosphate oxidase family protein [Aeromonadales bacterium]
MNIEQDWPEVKVLCQHAFRSSLHFSIASLDENNCPHVTPIGSVILGEKGKAIYFEKFTQHLKNNLSNNEPFSILAVNSNRWFWFKALISGKFDAYPALRLKGTAGISRAATVKEMQLWQNRVKIFSWTRGYKILWQEMSTVRELNITSVDKIHLASMTDSLG